MSLEEINQKDYEFSLFGLTALSKAESELKMELLRDVELSKKQKELEERLEIASEQAMLIAIASMIRENNRRLLEKLRLAGYDLDED
jgi:FlaA1/EpsC-like NDP-sugar epimerase